MTKATRSRELILDILLESLERGAFLHDVLRQALAKYQYLEKADRAFISRVSEGTVERLLTIDGILDRCSSVKTGKMKPVIREILRMSVYQLLWMDRVPDSAVCSEAVKLAEGRRFGGLKGFVNGVLRSVARRRQELLALLEADWSLRYSMPEWIIDLWRSRYSDEEVEAILQTFLQDTPVMVRCRRHPVSQDEIEDSLRQQGVRFHWNPLAEEVLVLDRYDYLEGLLAFQKGWIQVQDAGSALVGKAAAPRAGERVLDVCGAPGGKGLHMADLLDGTGQVWIRDLTEEKIRLVEENIRRGGFSNASAQVWDARVFDPSWEEKADLVIADLPCSGLGVIGRKPDIKYRASEKQIGELAELQRQILSVCARYVKPGGRLIYSTCTISPRENEEQRQWILRELPFVPMSLSHLAGESLREETLSEGYVQLLPGRHPCDGFFISAYQKRG